MYIAGGVVTVEQTTISGNIVVYVSAPSLPSFLIRCPLGVTKPGNLLPSVACPRTGQGGGGVYVRGGDIHFTDVNIYNNQAGTVSDYSLLTCSAFPSPPWEVC